MNPVDAVLFIGFGGPEKRADILPFLERVTRGRGIPQERLEEVAHHYEAIGGKSPINEITRRQAAGLEHQLKGLGLDLKVYVGNRNWHPFLEDTLRQMATVGIKYAIGFPTAAYRCEASWERYLKAVEQARQKIGPSAPEIEYVNPWFAHPLFIDAIAARLREVQWTDASWIFTAHSIPVSMAEGSRYVQELTRTAELVAEKFGIKNWTIAYTSRSGRPEDPWLEPDACDAIRMEAVRGAKEILIIPIGFVADHVEVLFDLDVEALDAAQKAGVKLRRSQTVGEHPLFLQMMADVVRKTAEACVPQSG